MLNVEVYKSIFYLRLNYTDECLLSCTHRVHACRYKAYCNSINIHKKEDFLEQYKTTMTGILKRHSKIYFSFVFIQTKRSLEDVKQSNSINQSINAHIISAQL